MANLIDLSKLQIGDPFRLGNDKFELAGMDAPWISNEAMKITSVTLHLKSLGYAGVTSPEDVRGNEEFRKTMANDHAAPPGATGPNAALAGQEANLDFDAGFVDEETAKKARAKMPAAKTPLPDNKPTK